MMTYELGIEGDNLPGTSVTVTAEAQFDLFGGSYTLLDPNDPNNDQYFSSLQTRSVSNGQTPTPLQWDLVDGNTTGAGCLMYGLYKFTGPDNTYFYIDYLHCYTGSPDIRIRLRYTGSAYVFEWRDYSTGSWVDVTGQTLSLYWVTEEPQDISCFQVDVLLQNVYHLAAGGTVNNHGAIFVDDIFTSYPSPSTVAFGLNTEHDSWPGSNLTNAVEQGVIHKLHNWNNYDTWHDVVLNDWAAEINGSVTANHETTEGSTGKVLFDGIASEADVKLRDPWKVVWPQNDRPYSDFDFNDFTFPASGFDFGDYSTYGGIFTGETPYTSGHSYYSIRTPEQLHWNGTDWAFLTPVSNPSIGDARYHEFQSLPSEYDIAFTDPMNSNHEIDDYATRDVTFNTEDAELRVEYKTHLLSGTTVSQSEAEGPLGANSQRQIGYLTQDAYVNVYESDENIWLVLGDLAAQDWNWEVHLGKGTHPSLFTVEDSAFVTWVGDDGRIDIGKYHDGQFEHFECTYDIDLDPSDEAFPVVACADDLVVLVYESWDMPDLTYVVIQCDNVLDQGYLPQALGTGSTCETPSITAEDGPYFDIAWREGDDIGTILLTVTTWKQPVEVWLTYLQVLPRYNENFVGAPSITNYHSGAQPPNEIYRIIAAPSRGPLGQAMINIYCLDAMTRTWSNMQSFFGSVWADDIWAPSISSIDRSPCVGAYDNVRCVFNVTDQTMYPTGYYTRAVRVDCGSWTVTEPHAPTSIHPSLVAFPPPDRGMGVYVDLQSSDVPQPLASSAKQLGFTNNALNKSTATTALRSSRVLWLGVDTTWYGTGIGRVTHETGGASDEIAWTEPARPQNISTAAAANSYLTTEAFTLTPQSILRYDLLKTRTAAQSLPSGTMLYVDLVDAVSGQVLAVLESVQPNNVQSGRNVATIARNISGYGSRGVRIRLRLVSTSANMSIAVADYYNLDPSSATGFPKAEHETVIQAADPIASEIRLDQNYPNPFNPTTTLTYYLPRTMHVTLLVYDYLGNEVCRLADGEMEAGLHTTEFDATNLPSGVYIAKLVSRHNVLTRRMTLLR